MNSNWKINFSFEWVNTQEKKSLQSENFEEKDKVIPSAKVEREEKIFKVEEVFIEEKKGKKGHDFQKRIRSERWKKSIYSICLWKVMNGFSSSYGMWKQYTKYV